MLISKNIYNKIDIQKSIIRWMKIYFSLNYNKIGDLSLHYIILR
jgi:hypothetical protein